MNHLHRAPRKGVFRDVHAIYDLVEITPGLPWPTTSPARAVFDYRHVVHAEDAREAVDCAAAVLTFTFAAEFGPERTEVNGADGPRYLLEALLPSGLTLVIISRVSLADEPAGRETELAVAAA